MGRSFLPQHAAHMPNPISLLHRIRPYLIAAILIGLLAVIVRQQTRIRSLERGKENIGKHEEPMNRNKTTRSSGISDDNPASGVGRRSDRSHEETANQRTAAAEAQLAEISSPLTSDMASTMFNADVKAGQSVVTGGYQTSDGRNQFTILKPRVVTDRNGGKQIEIDSNLIAMSPEDTKRSGLDSLATNAKNTLQHAESWDESDVSSTMDMIRNSADSEHLGQPKAIVGPGQSFSIQMTSDDESGYTLKGTAELSQDGSGVVLKARIEQKESGK